MREIVFDTETTGFDFSRGDRMVEIGCVELFNRCETGRDLPRLLPSRARYAGRRRSSVHGLSATFLAKFPLFADGAHELIEFIGDAPLIAHNATFDFAFLNGELGRCGRDPVCDVADASTRWRWRRNGILAPSTRSTRCAPATASTARTACSTARCSTRSCSRRSMSS